MMCRECKKNPATFAYKSNINGIITENYLCKECYEKKMGKVYNDSISQLVDAFYGKSRSDALPDIKCSVCGTKLSDIADTFYAGCPNCYIEMRDFLMQTVKNVQNAVLHSGKRPLAAAENVSSEYQRLKSELGKSIEQENFEQAAIISARLKQLRGEV